MSEFTADRHAEPQQALARAFVEWLRVPPGKRWLIVGAHALSLTQAALADAPQSIHALVASDQAAAFAQVVADPRVTWQISAGERLPWELGPFEVVVAGGSIQDTVPPMQMAMELARVTQLNGTVAAYVFESNPGTEILDRRGLWGLWLDARLNDVTTSALETEQRRAWAVRGVR